MADPTAVHRAVDQEWGRFIAAVQRVVRQSSGHDQLIAIDHHLNGVIHAATIWRRFADSHATA